MDAPLRGPREVGKTTVHDAIQLTEHERRRRPETRGRKPALTEAQAGRGLLCSWPFGFRAVKKRLEKCTVSFGVADRAYARDSGSRKPMFDACPQVKRVQQAVKKQRAARKDVSYAWIKRKFNLSCCNSTIKKHVFKPMKWKYCMRARKPAVPRSGLRSVWHCIGGLVGTASTLRHGCIQI